MIKWFIEIKKSFYYIIISCKKYFFCLITILTNLGNIFEMQKSKVNILFIINFLF